MSDKRIPEPWVPQVGSYVIHRGMKYKVQSVNDTRMDFTEQITCPYNPVLVHLGEEFVVNSNECMSATKENCEKYLLENDERFQDYIDNKKFFYVNVPYNYIAPGYYRQLRQFDEKITNALPMMSDVFITILDWSQDTKFKTMDQIRAEICKLFDSLGIVIFPENPEISVSEFVELPRFLARNIKLMFYYEQLIEGCGDPEIAESLFRQAESLRVFHIVPIT